MSMFHALFGRNAFIIGEVGRDRIVFKGVGGGGVFDEPPLIAIEEKQSRKLVKAVGRDASGLEGTPGVTVHNPFESVEPLFSHTDLAEPLVQHAIREVHKLRSVVSPRLVLRLNGRTTFLSDDEKTRLNKFSYSCGINMLYVFLEGETLPTAEELKHAHLVGRAHYVAKGAP